MERRFLYLSIEPRRGMIQFVLSAWLSLEVGLNKKLIGYNGQAYLAIFSLSYSCPRRLVDSNSKTTHKKEGLLYLSIEPKARHDPIVLSAWLSFEVGLNKKLQAIIG